jgi:oxygen-independent coproporphyrinogen III oxidase
MRRISHTNGDRPASGSHHLYVHVPFCRLVCAYCDFVTVGGRAADIPRYVEALLAELELRPADGRLQTMYFGGGTPSLLPVDDVARLVAAAVRRWGASPTEVTIEANPSTRETPDWAGLRAAGVNRVSLGVQSLRDAELRSLARGHTADEARAALRSIRAAGFGNISIDLIYGIPGQSLEAWRAGLAEAVALAPDHLALYGLQLALAPDEWAAPPRPGAIRWRQRASLRQDEDLAASQYELAEEVLAAAGFRHYELSSWARPGHESRHNAAYWARRPYTGIGAGAHSFNGVTRSWNERDLDRYLVAVEQRLLPISGSDVLDERARAFEAVALGLRKIDGLDLDAFRTEFHSDAAERYRGAVAAAIGNGLLELDAARMWLTPRGRLLANEVLVGFLPAR